MRDANGAVIGFTNMAEIPGTPWRIHDAARPHPRVVTPGPTSSAPPSDAIVLFDGKDLSKFAHSKGGQLLDPQWAVRDGYFEVVPKTGGIVTRDKFGDVQLHLEFAMPNPGRGASQDRGNSGVIFMGFYEIQVLDSFENTHVRGWTGGVDLRRISTTRERRAETWGVADLRHRVRGAEVQGHHARDAGICHGDLERSARAPSARADGSDLSHDDGAWIHTARRGAAVFAAGSLAPGAVPEHLGAPADRATTSRSGSEPFSTGFGSKGDRAPNGSSVPF